MNRLVTTRPDIRMWPRRSVQPRGLAYCTHKYYTGHIIANYCFQNLIGLANLLSAISFMSPKINKKT